MMLVISLMRLGKNDSCLLVGELQANTHGHLLTECGNDSRRPGRFTYASWGKMMIQRNDRSAFLLFQVLNRTRVLLLHDVTEEQSEKGHE